MNYVPIRFYLTMVWAGVIGFVFFLHEDFMTFGSRAMAILILTQCTQNYAWGHYAEIYLDARL